MADLRLGHPQNRVILAAALWGFCEATWFFVLPDVWLSFVALLGLRLALVSMVGAIVGGMLGGTVLYTCSAWDWPHLWQSLPGFREPMLAAASSHLAHGAAGLVNGPVAGIPYRVYVWVGARQGLSLGDILLWTPLARGERMIVPVGVAFGMYHLTRRFLKRPLLTHALLWMALWCLIYVFYWGWFLPARFAR